MDPKPKDSVNSISWEEPMKLPIVNPIDKNVPIPDSYRLKAPTSSHTRVPTEAENQLCLKYLNERHPYHVLAMEHYNKSIDNEEEEYKISSLELRKGKSGIMYFGRLGSLHHLFWEAVPKNSPSTVEPKIFYARVHKMVEVEGIHIPYCGFYSDSVDSESCEICGLKNSDEFWKKEKELKDKEAEKAKAIRNDGYFHPRWHVPSSRWGPKQPDSIDSISWEEHKKLPIVNPIDKNVSIPGSYLLKAPTSSHTCVPTEAEKQLCLKYLKQTHPYHVLAMEHYNKSIDNEEEEYKISSLELRKGKSGIMYFGRLGSLHHLFWEAVPKNSPSTVEPKIFYARVHKMVEVEGIHIPYCGFYSDSVDSESCEICGLKNSAEFWKKEKELKDKEAEKAKAILNDGYFHPRWYVPSSRWGPIQPKL